MSGSFRRQPVIIMGMHRSGTSLLARLLSRLGLFLGHRVESHHEAVFFLHLNEVILRQARASWDRPDPIGDFVQNAEIVRMTLRCLERDLLSWRSARYLGWWNLLRARSLATFDRPWGWKDPRNVLTLPLWVALFPGAKIVYIVRHGVDVARSLVVRERQYLRWQWVRFHERFHRPSLRTHVERLGFRGSTRCLTLDGAFDLWTTYLAYAERWLARLANERMIIRYEDFVREPVPFLRALADFCGLSSARRRDIDEAARDVDGRRAYAFASDPSLVAFFHRVRANAWMERYGYSEIVRPSAAEARWRRSEHWSALPRFPLPCSSGSSWMKIEGACGGARREGS